MKILNNKINIKQKSGTLDLIPENTDDIYTLYNLIDKGDHIKSKTTRKIIIGDTGGSKGKSSKNTSKISVVLEIKTESINVDLEASTLFIKGVILTDDVQHVKSGSYHTIDIFPGQRFKIYKKEWCELTLKSLRDIQNVKSSEMLFIIIQETAFVFCDVTHNYTNILRRVEYKGKKYKKALEYISTCTLDKYSIVVLSSNLDIMNEFKKDVLKDNRMKQLLAKKFITLKNEANTNDITKVIGSMLIDPAIYKMIVDVQFVEELKEMSLLLKNIEYGVLTCVGFEDLTEALSFGAVKTLLLTNEMFKSYDLDNRKRVEEICKEAKFCRISIHIVPIKHWLGTRLQELGGIAANLKYEYK